VRERKQARPHPKRLRKPKASTTTPTKGHCDQVGGEGEHQRCCSALAVVGQPLVPRERVPTLKRKTRRMPVKKAAVPRSLSLRAKNNSVLRGPMRAVIPARKRI
jgi:hypothetical protein